MTEQHREIIELAVFDLESKSGVRWGPEYMEDFAAAIRAMLAENVALKANDPLAEMWRELSEYQPFANRDGHGESWRRMCSERTEAAAHAAAWARGASPTASEWSLASRAADAAARAAEEAAICAQRAIAAIRRAKGAR